MQFLNGQNLYKPFRGRGIYSRPLRIRELSCFDQGVMPHLTKDASGFALQGREFAMSDSETCRGKARLFVVCSVVYRECTMTCSWLLDLSFAWFCLCECFIFLFHMATWQSSWLLPVAGCVIGRANPAFVCAFIFFPLFYAPVSLSYFGF